MSRNTTPCTRDLDIDRGTNDLDVGFALQRFAIDLPHHGRVVDDHYLDFGGHDYRLVSLGLPPFAVSLSNRGILAIPAFDKLRPNGVLKLFIWLEWLGR